MLVLLVDDNETFLNAAAEYLGRQDASLVLHIARTPDAAIRAMTAFAYDGVVTDLRLGSASGFTLLSECLKLQPDVPVVVLTGYGDARLSQEAAKRGAYAFLHKPIDPDAFYSVIKRASLRRALRREPPPSTSPLSASDAWSRDMEKIRSRIHQLDERLRQTLQDSSGIPEDHGHSGPL